MMLFLDFAVALRDRRGGKEKKGGNHTNFNTDFNFIEVNNYSND